MLNIPICNGLKIILSLNQTCRDLQLEMTCFLDGRLDILISGFHEVQKKGYQFQITFESGYLQKYPALSLVQTLGFKVHQYQQGSALSCRIAPIADSIFEYAEAQPMFKEMMLESLALQILFHALEDRKDCDKTPCFNCRFLNIPSEKQKIMQARVLAMIHLSEPLSIPALARAVHINECYLKKGFKELFGTSIYDFIQQERVRKAKHFLSGSRISVQQIALELGYSNTSNFTNAFKKLTGLSPTEWQKISDKEFA
jgi:YesN/AraC family two-component response regulator